MSALFELRRLRPRLCMPLAIRVSGDRTRSFFTINEVVKLEAVLLLLLAEAIPLLSISLSPVMLIEEEELIEGRLRDIEPDVDAC